MLEVRARAPAGLPSADCADAESSATGTDNNGGKLHTPAETGAEFLGPIPPRTHEKPRDRNHKHVTHEQKWLSPAPRYGLPRLDGPRVLPVP